MSEAEVTRDGVRHRRPGREAVPGGRGGSRGRGGGRRRRNGRKGRGERTMVPDAEFTSYYGRPILKQPTWKALDIAGYLFLGGLAGASSLLAAAAQASGRPGLARPCKIGALGAISLSTAALIHDLGRPGRFANMLRVMKPTSPMSVGSWILAAYGPAAGVAAVTGATGLFPRIGRAATGWAALTGPAVVTYTGVLIADTAIPVWHGAYREMPFLFAGSAAASAGGLGLLTAPTAENGPARSTAAFGAALDLGTGIVMRRRLGPLAEPYEQGKAARLMRAAEVLTGTGAVAGLLAGGRSRSLATVAGAALLAGSAATRFAVFEAGRASAADPKYVVQSQRSPEPG
ncbi:polysulfide reductase NrfD [Actinomadura barringtoniae]|uniref:Polysulfide reductase NrfD n=1 Tax=Actinomadura barringtoniae TaxID=1427535 RepID=A0A939PNN5_9ACTN|nr:NrfD/PsrC family molybdoenzyme membrane anchor subunit [Actinomadura barringtoniae]MBO2453408.1 polysulfide reductase NrfD [Actinomadura barringtoniae]